jgi:hypothetical protein
MLPPPASVRTGVPSALGAPGPGESLSPECGRSLTGPPTQLATSSAQHGKTRRKIAAIRRQLRSSLHPKQAASATSSASGIDITKSTLILRQLSRSSLCAQAMAA